MLKTHRISLSSTVTCWIIIHLQTQKDRDAHIKSALIIYHMWWWVRACPHGWQTITYSLQWFWNGLDYWCRTMYAWIAWIGCLLHLRYVTVLPCTHVFICIHDCAHVCSPVSPTPVWSRVSSVLSGSVEAGPLWWVLWPPAACASHPQCGVVGRLCWCARWPTAYQQWWQLPEGHLHCQPPTQTVPAEEG